MVYCLGVFEDAGVLLVAQVLQVDAQQRRLVTKELGQLLHSVDKVWLAISSFVEFIRSKVTVRNCSPFTNSVKIVTVF